MSREAEEVGSARQRHQIELSTTRALDGVEELDIEAREEAAEAHRKIKSHEELCTERWNQQRLSMGIMQRCLDDLAKNSIGRMPAGIIGVLMGACGWLAARAFPIGHG